ncbi:hypothetical protein [Nocardia sp. CC227C]|uniref:hypothetical protein n=1 Tax=Nocardia sp. CC227C TaxID=3044562 RepID=UPI00278BC874|nr:hypothetical protein [Nocardia sp. CC227C]
MANINTYHLMATGSVILTSALGLSACAGEGESVGPPRTTTVLNLPPTPTSQVLNSDLQKALDPTVPNEGKFDLLQGVQADPELPGRLAHAFRQNNATITVTSVADLGYGTITAQAQASLNNGESQQVVVPFVAEGGKWKIQLEWVCGALSSFAVQDSPACL